MFPWQRIRYVYCLQDSMTQQRGIRKHVGSIQCTLTPVPCIWSEHCPLQVTQSCALGEGREAGRQAEGPAARRWSVCCTFH